MGETTKKLLTKHCNAYPKLQPQDIFKYMFQSSFGCEHLVSDEKTALEYIKREYETVPEKALPLTEQLDGNYSRVHLSWLNAGIKAETLAKIFCLSSKKEANGNFLIREKIEIAMKLVEENKLPFDVCDFKTKLDEWQKNGCHAVHHSENFRLEYSPSYRVVSDRYTPFLQLFAQIDKLSDKEKIVVAIEGASASGKTTLAEMLSRVYDCNVFHMDDYFLRPEQRTPERFAEIGGNVDRERFAKEILEPLMNNETVNYRPFDCSTQTLGETVTVLPKKLTIVEGVYSAHPAFSKYYDIAVFLNVDEECQKKRILARNGEKLAERFFGEWIPLENRYFSGTDIKNRADLIFDV